MKKYLTFYKKQSIIINNEIINALYEINHENITNSSIDS